MSHASDPQTSSEHVTLSRTVILLSGIVQLVGETILTYGIIWQAEQGNGPQRCPQANPWNLWRWYLTRQRGLCKCDSTKDPEII